MRIYLLLMIAIFGMALSPIRILELVSTRQRSQIESRQYHESPYMTVLPSVLTPNGKKIYDDVQNKAKAQLEAASEGREKKANPKRKSYWRQITIEDDEAIRLNEKNKRKSSKKQKLKKLSIKHTKNQNKPDNTELKFADCLSSKKWHKRSSIELEQRLTINAKNRANSLLKTFGGKEDSHVRLEELHRKLEITRHAIAQVEQKNAQKEAPPLPPRPASTFLSTSAIESSVLRRPLLKQISLDNTRDKSSRDIFSLLNPSKQSKSMIDLKNIHVPKRVKNKLIRHKKVQEIFSTEEIDEPIYMDVRELNLPFKTGKTHRFHLQNKRCSIDKEGGPSFENNVALKPHSATNIVSTSNHVSPIFQASEALDGISGGASDVNIQSAKDSKKINMSNFLLKH